MEKVNLLGGKPRSIRVIIADNTPMGGQLLADALRRSHRFGTVLVANQAAEFMAAASAQRPDVALISTHFEGDAIRGFTLAQELSAAQPGLKVVMLLDTPDRQSVVKAFRVGCQGIFCRKRPVQELLKCISCVHSGQVWGSTEEFGFVLEALREPQPLRVVNTAGVALLTKREMAVVQCVAEGFTNRETATQLNLSEHTVKNYMFRIFDKLGVSSRVELILHVANQMQSAASSIVAKPLQEAFPAPPASPSRRHALGVA